jgi:hypothetical protein
MDETRLDRIARSIGVGLSRRAAMRRFGGGLLGAALATGAVATERAAAQEACVMRFEAVVRDGPSAGREYSGELTLPITATGAIDEGKLILEGAISAPVVGQVTGRSISILVKAGESGSLYGLGVAEVDLGTCQGEFEGPMAGPFVGPIEGDRGDWRTCGKLCRSCATC